MTLDDEKSKQPERLSKPSSAPTLKDDDLAGVLESYPAESLEVLANLLSDPVKISRFTAKLSYYRGDLLPPEILEEYERVRPGAAKWVLDHVDNQKAHRHALERLRTEKWEARADRAQWFGIIIAVVGTITAGVVALATQAWVFPSMLAIAAIGGPSAAQTLARSLRHRMGEKTGEK